MKRVSTKMAKQHRLEAQLKKSMIEKAVGSPLISFGPCAMCGKYRYLGKHEINPRSLGGDPLDEKNCVLLCNPCNDWEKEHPTLRHRKREDFPFRGPV